MAAPQPSATRQWSSYGRELLFSRRPPLLGSIDPDKIEEAARQKLADHPGAAGYLFGNAGTGQTHRANRRAFERWEIVPRMLRDASQRSLQTTLFGATLPSPLVIAPIAAQSLWHADAECGTARAAGALGIPVILSGASSRSLESVAAANGANSPRWFQLYWPTSEDLTRSLLSRARASGYTVLVVTVDTMALGWRSADLDIAFMPFMHGVGVEVALSDPVLMARAESVTGKGAPPHAEENAPRFPYDGAAMDAALARGDPAARELVAHSAMWLRESVNGVFRTWEDVRALRKLWDGPVVVKGILSVQDAETAIEEGLDGIVVSNHGGRQIDGAISSLRALERIMKSPRVRDAQARGAFTVMLDSGVRTGSDVFRAIALGAQAVLLGRPYIYGLTIAGQEGVEAVVKTILAEFELTLGLAGQCSIADIHGKADEFLVKADD